MGYVIALFDYFELQSLKCIKMEFKMPKRKQYRMFSKNDFPQDFSFCLNLTKKGENG